MQTVEQQRFPQATTTNIRPYTHWLNLTGGLSIWPARRVPPNTESCELLFCINHYEIKVWLIGRMSERTFTPSAGHTLALKHRSVKRDIGVDFIGALQRSYPKSVRYWSSLWKMCRIATEQHFRPRSRANSCLRVKSKLFDLLRVGMTSEAIDEPHWTSKWGGATGFCTVVCPAQHRLQHRCWRCWMDCIVERPKWRLENGPRQNVAIGILPKRTVCGIIKGPRAETVRKINQVQMITRLRLNNGEHVRPIDSALKSALHKWHRNFFRTAQC